ncbi:hypothetical protein M5689_005031 [Euphorbia peplus]|nr:hypothetical protein M5689_005031 [Euphorbia peplus]
MNQLRRSAMLLRSTYLELHSVFGSIRLPVEFGSNKMLSANGNSIQRRWQHGKEFMVGIGSQFRVTKMCGAKNNPYFARSFASSASKQTGEQASEAKKDKLSGELVIIGLLVVLLLGCGGLLAAISYKESKEKKMFNIALKRILKRIQDDAQVRARIGSPITGERRIGSPIAGERRIGYPITEYHQVSQIHPAWEQIPIDGDAVLMNFHIRGPHGSGKVSAMTLKNKVDKQWKYTNLRVQINQTQTELILESEMSAPAPVA